MIDGAVALGSGRYVLERELGRGGMAEVYAAHDTTLDRRVAVKVLARRLAGDAGLRERFVHEGRYAARLSHPNVVGVYDSGDDGGIPYIVMELVEGTTLQEELDRRGAFPAAEVESIARQACAGLAHAHDAGIVHRDVKPQNLLLTPSGEVKISDFGIARGDEGPGITQAGELLGTVEYLAPEVVDGHAATAASDLYALGGVLYRLLTGEPPRRVRTLDDVTRRERIRPPRKLVRDPPPGLERAIMACLDTEPLRRPQSARELSSLLDGAPPATTHLEPVTEARIVGARIERTRPARRIWLLVLLPVVAVLAVAGSLLAGGGDGAKPVRTGPTPLRQGGTPGQDAQQLADWLRANAAP